VCGVFDAFPCFGNVGVPALADCLPLRRRAVAGVVCLGFQLIGGGGCLVSRPGDFGFKLIPGGVAGGLQFVGRGLALSEIFSNSSLRSVCGIESSFQPGRDFRHMCIVCASGRFVIVRRNRVGRPRLDVPTAVTFLRADIEACAGL
jgi:hypothetical protein